MVNQMYLDNWHNATANVPTGLQMVLKDALSLAAEGKITLVYGADARDGKPCLLNAVRNMTTQFDLKPSTYAPAVVAAFDDLNHALWKDNVNESTHKVSPLAAEVLLRHFGPVDPSDYDVEHRALALESFAVNCTPYIEPTDDEMLTDWLLNSTVRTEQDAPST